MRHDFIDHHSRPGGPLQRLHPAGKVLAAGLAVVAASVVPAPRFAPFLPLLALCLAGALFGRLRPDHLLGKVWLPLGFTVLAVLPLPWLRPAGIPRGGWPGFPGLPFYPDSAWLALHAIARAAVILLLVILLMATTPFGELMHVLDRCRVPRIFLRILALLYRYLFIVVDEAEKMQLAIACRSVGPLPARRYRRMLGNAVGTLFLRSLERGEAVYQAMLARGFSGRFPSLAPGRWGLGELVLLTAALGLAALSGWGSWTP